MGIARELLLRGSQSRWLEDQVTRRRFTRRAVKRFMPGETLEAALEAATALSQHRISAVLTLLGENVADAGEAEGVASHYLEVLERVRAHGLDAHISVKPTQLGLDFGFEQTLTNLERIATKAEAAGTVLAIDMEASAYVDRTIELYRHLRADHSNVALCLQSYLYRTADDLEVLLPLAPAIRLVKGAYKEPADIAYPRKKDVDANFLALTDRLLEELRSGNLIRLSFGTHDARLIRQIKERAEQRGVGRDVFDFQMLYGIGRESQRQLAADGYGMRVLISYGESWFPWYMRRLAERPANVLFVVRNLFSK